jgi:hypothetical protein
VVQIVAYDGFVKITKLDSVSVPAIAARENSAAEPAGPGARARLHRYSQTTGGRRRL